MYRLHELDEMLNSPFTHELLNLIEKYQDDPTIIDSLIIAIEMLLAEKDERTARKIRQFAFYTSSEKVH
ncbi:MAG: hypothetical protein ABDH19_03485 [Thermodesulfovibrio sp.]